MRFIRTAKVGTNALSELFGGEQPIAFDHIAFGMDPFGLNRIEPGAFGGQEQRQNTHAFALGFDQTVLLSYPGLQDSALVSRTARSCSYERKHYPRSATPDCRIPAAGYPLLLKCETVSSPPWITSLLHGRSLLIANCSQWAFLSSNPRSHCASVAPAS